MMTQIEATQALRNDHKRMRGLFRQVETVDLRAKEMKEGVVREIFMELEIHTTVEEEIFYPSLRDVLDEEHLPLIDQSFQEHADLKASIGVLRSMDWHTQQFDERLTDLIATVEQHVTKEEDDLFPVAERVLEPHNRELGDRILARREQLLKSEQYRGSRPEDVQNPNGGEQMRKRSA